MPNLQGQGRALLRELLGFDNVVRTRRALEHQKTGQPAKRKSVLEHGEPPYR
jgi:hypothetical protein